MFCCIKKCFDNKKIKNSKNIDNNKKIENIDNKIIEKSDNKNNIKDEKTNIEEKFNKIEKYKKGIYYKYIYESEEINKFELKNINLYVKIIDIYDGDTVTGIIFYNNIPYIIKIRLLRIDTPEMKGINETEELNIKEKALAIICKYILYYNIKKYDNMIYIKTFGNDKYGRTLGELYNNKKEEICFNDLLINSNYCDKYEGGKKKRLFEKMYYDLDKSLEIIKIYNDKNPEEIIKYLEKMNIIC